MTVDRGQRFLVPRASHSVAIRGRATHAVVGIGMIESMLMTPGAQANEMQRIDSDMRTFGVELANAVHAAGSNVAPLTNATDDFTRFVHDVAAQPAAVTDKPIVRLFHDAWAPLLQTWSTFYAENHDGRWMSNPVSEAEKYQEQLAEIRGKASDLGLKLLSPAPKAEHPDGLPSWFLPAAAVAGGLVALSILTRGD